MSVLGKIAEQLIQGILPAGAEKELAAERIKMCEDCEFFAPMTRQCRRCMCFMDLKTKMLNARCPLDKW